MLVYITTSSKTELAPAAIRGLSLWHLSVGGGFLARRRAAKYLRRLYEAGVRRGVFDTAALAALIVRLTSMDRRGMGKAIVTYGIFMSTWAPICLWCLIRPVRVWREMPHGLARNTAAGI